MDQKATIDPKTAHAKNKDTNINQNNMKNRGINAHIRLTRKQ